MQGPVFFSPKAHILSIKFIVISKFWLASPSATATKSLTVTETMHLIRGDRVRTSKSFQT